MSMTHSSWTKGEKKKTSSENGPGFMASAQLTVHIFRPVRYSLNTTPFRQNYRSRLIRVYQTSSVTSNIVQSFAFESFTNDQIEPSPRAKVFPRWVESFLATQGTFQTAVWYVLFQPGPQKATWALLPSMPIITS